MGGIIYRVTGEIQFQILLTLLLCDDHVRHILLQIEHTVKSLIYDAAIRCRRKFTRVILPQVIIWLVSLTLE